MRLLPLVKSLLWLGLIGLGVLLTFGYARRHPEDMPWTALDLGEPVGLFTGRKVAALTGDGAMCEALLTRAGVRFTPLPPVSAGRCGYTDGLRLGGGAKDGDARTIALSPAGLGTSCAVAAGLTLWEWNVVQPAAARHLGSTVTRIDHLGSYSCRRIGNGSTGSYSEHSTADAVDIAGFRFADGTRVTLAADWNGSPARAAFLREVGQGACSLFSTVLSPDYNAAHRDHFHLDQAERGAVGGRACR